jgi:hypothetical protein
MIGFEMGTSSNSRRAGACREESTRLALCIDEDEDEEDGEDVEEEAGDMNMVETAVGVRGDALLVDGI